MKKKIEELKYRLSYAIYIFFSFFCGKILKINLSRKLFAKLSFFFYYFLPLRKKIVLKNLKIVFPTLTEKQRKKIARDAYASFAVTLAEIFCLNYMSLEEAKKEIIFKKAENITNIKSDKKNRIFVTAHFGNWEFGAIGFRVHFNSPLYVVVKKLKNKYVSDWMINLREKFDNKAFSKGISLKEILKALYEGKNIGIVGDQRGPRDGKRIKFFARQASVFTGAASLSVRSGVPIIAAFVVRRPDYKYEVIFENIYDEQLNEAYEDKALELTAKYFKVLERYIVNYPEQWLWHHDRWKY
jgi:KDO2-lipid IV(A) lauroyltransferase